MKKFLQKLIKKPLALVMALLIVLGSVSAAVYAMYINDEGEMKSYIHISKLNDDGTTYTGVNYDTGTDMDKQTGALNVKPGDKIKVTVSLYTKRTKLSQDSQNDGIESDFNVYMYNPYFYFNSDLLMMDSSDAADAGEYLTRKSGQNNYTMKYRDAKEQYSLIGHAIGFTGDDEAAAALTDTSDHEDGFVDYNGRSVIDCYTIIESNGELDPNGNGKDVLTF